MPYLFEGFDEWVKGQSDDRDPFLRDMDGLERENLTLEPGDPRNWEQKTMLVQQSLTNWGENCLDLIVGSV